MILKPILFIALILLCLYLMYWMIREGDNVKKQQREDRYDIIEDDFI